MITDVSINLQSYRVAICLPTKKKKNRCVQRFELVIVSLERGCFYGEKENVSFGDGHCCIFIWPISISIVD